MLHDDSSRIGYQRGEFTPLLLLCLAIAILCVVGFLSLLVISSYSDSSSESAAFLVLGGVLLLMACAAVMAGLKYLRLAASLNDKQQGLLRNIQLLEGFFDTNPSIMWVKNIEGGYNLVNQGFRKFTGLNDMAVENIEQSRIFKYATATRRADQEKQVVTCNSPMAYEAVWQAPEWPKNY